MDTDRKASATPVRPMHTKKMSTEVLGEVKPSTAMGSATSSVPMTIAFQELPVFLPTQAPAKVGRSMQMMVRGICREPATVVALPMTVVTAMGAYTFMAPW